MTPTSQYAADLLAGIIQIDSAQQQQVAHLDELFKAVVHWQQQKKRFIHKIKRQPPPRGWYCHGGVGIGKTYLMDLFFESLKQTDVHVKRLHFHDFMRTVHAQLTEMQGIAEPLEKIAKKFVKQCDVLCFDEFMVHDIADAMLLGRLLKYLFAEGLVLLATSNSAPTDLYRNGLQRSQFLPAIALLQQQCVVMHLETVIDYRMQQLLEKGIYFHPPTVETALAMQNCFLHLTSQRGQLNQSILLHDRTIPVRGLGSEVIWFDFNVLCSVGRSQHDYMSLAHSFHTVLISGIPRFSEADIDRVTLFIYLIDVLYDARIKVILEADADPNELYVDGRKRAEFQRTESRLHEMQSAQYLHSLVRE